MRRLLAIFALWSVIVWMIVLAGWIRSWTHYDRAFWTQGQRLFYIDISGRGLRTTLVEGWRSTEPFTVASQTSEEVIRQMPDLEKPALSVNEIEETQLSPAYWVNYISYVVFMSKDRQVAGNHAVVVVGIGWLLMLSLPLIFPALWAGLIIREWHRRRARESIGLCPVCGYDLRATPQRCPECGAATDTADAV